MKIMKKVSFDFDSTLTQQHVKDFAKSLIYNGYDVWIITSRLGCTTPTNGRHKIDNSDLFKVAEDLGIPKEKCIFTDHRLKSEVINELGLDLIFHLDDDWVEINHINSETQTTGISCWGTTKWKQKCIKLMNEYRLQILIKNTK